MTQTGAFSSALKLASFFIVVSRTAQAICSYNATQDWTPMLSGRGPYANPTMPWTVGYTATPSNPLAFEAFQTSLTGFASSLNCLVTNQGDYPFFCLYYNSVPNYGCEPGQIVLHPGPGLQDKYSVLRFIVPRTAEYDIDVNFYRGELPDASTIAYIYLDGNPVIPGQQTPFTGRDVGLLTAGQVFDFMVGPGDDGITTDTTPIDIFIREEGCGK